jgi:transposase
VPQCLIGIEAGMPTHYVARELIALGHDVKQVPPAYAKPFRQGHKNDFRDAQAIAEAQRPLPKQRADDQRRHCAGHSRSAAQLSIVPFEANGVEFCADAEERRSSQRDTNGPSRA